MQVAYVDTSYLLALAFNEPGCSDVAARLSTFDRLVSSNLLEAELRSAVARERVDAEVSQLTSRLDWIHPDRPLTEEFKQILAAGQIKGADLWHLACALFLTPDRRGITFLTLDKRQRRVAEALGFPG
jgi:predicted nucleic acid-binding protein